MPATKPAAKPDTSLFGRLSQAAAQALANRIVLGATQHLLDAPEKRPFRVQHGDGHLELWEETHHGDGSGPFVLKFPGTNSRAETAASLALQCWSRRGTTVWSVNPPGYGGSSGEASLANIPAMATRALQAIREVAGERPVIAEGFSLGCVSALYLGAQGLVDGLVLRNPPPLRETLRARSRWSLGLVSALADPGIPEVIDCVANAAACRVPTVTAIAFEDRIVPLACQRLVVDGYGGEQRVLEQRGAGHVTPYSEDDMERLCGFLEWLRGCVVSKPAQHSD
jgi:pimeloyl-ACP methyl ester carboxylesterase